MNEKFQAEVKIESKWLEYSEIASYDPNKNWNPLLFIENLIVTTSETVTYKMTKENGYNVITETRHAKGHYHFGFQFSCVSIKLPNIRLFPIFE